MDIEAIVTKYERLIPAGAYTLAEGIRAAMTELAAGYEEHLAESERKLEVSGYAWSLMGEELNTLLEELAESRERIQQLEAKLGGYITVGGGHIVHGTIEALARVQAYILLDSKHPIEARDTNRYFAKELQAAEQQIKQLEAELAESREQAERMLDAIYKLHPLASRTLWMAFVWNDHNFTHPLDYAREEAKKAGFNCLEDAQEFLADVAMLAAAPAKEGE